jgi:hypothetical protein
MHSISKRIDVQLVRMSRGGRWLGLRVVSSHEGSIGLGVAEIVYSLGSYARPSATERVEPWLSSD